MVWEIVAFGAGATLVALGLTDAFLTILHPDLDGPVTRRVNRVVWRLATSYARLLPSRRRQALAYAGPLMILGDVLTWMALPILGYGLMVWPFLGPGFDAPSALSMEFWDAMYFSGVTFTTLGFGDIVPVQAGWEMLAVGEAVSGFLVMSTSIAYVIAVFEGTDHRDALALRVYSETDGTWEGMRFLERSLRDEGPEILRQRLEAWAELVRQLHGRLYRFHGLAFYLRTRGIRHGPERMMYAIAEVALGANILARAPHLRALRPAAEHLALGFEHFAAAIVHRHGTKRERRLMEKPEPADAEAARIREHCRGFAERLDLTITHEDLAQDTRLLEIAARRHVFLAHVDAFTLWRGASDPRKEPGPERGPRP